MVRWVSGWGGGKAWLSCVGEEGGLPSSVAISRQSQGVAECGWLLDWAACGMQHAAAAAAVVAAAPVAVVAFVLFISNTFYCFMRLMKCCTAPNRHHPLPVARGLWPVARHGATLRVAFTFQQHIKHFWQPNCLLDWLPDWLPGWLTDWLTAWLGVRLVSSRLACNA